MMADLMWELRNPFRSDGAATMAQAADRIEQLEAEVEALQLRNQELAGELSQAREEKIEAVSRIINLYEPLHSEMMRELIDLKMGKDQCPGNT